MWNVIFIDLPTKVNEAVTLNEDGSYTIFINSRISYENRLRAYKHALIHIKNNDFEHTDRLSEVEERTIREVSNVVPDDEFWQN